VVLVEVRCIFTVRFRPNNRSTIMPVSSQFVIVNPCPRAGARKRVPGEQSTDSISHYRLGGLVPAVGGIAELERDAGPAF